MGKELKQLNQQLEESVRETNKRHILSNVLLISTIATAVVWALSLYADAH